MLSCGLYTDCKEFLELWDVEKVLWSILVQMDSAYTF